MGGMLVFFFSSCEKMGEFTVRNVHNTTFGWSGDREGGGGGGGCISIQHLHPTSGYMWRTSGENWEKWGKMEEIGEMGESGGGRWVTCGRNMVHCEF